MNLKLRLVIDYYIGGLLHVLLKIPTILLGKILQRNHELKDCPDVTILKMLGGGSLAIAYPALLALKQSDRIRRLRLVTSPGVRPFGEALGLFDEIIVIRDGSLVTTVTDSLSALRKLFRCGAIIDLEIHSRLTTVFALLTCAQNRISFYTAISFWRKGISTHLLFCNISNGIYDNYDQLAAIFATAVPSFPECYPRGFHAPSAWAGRARAGPDAAEARRGAVLLRVEQRAHAAHRRVGGSDRTQHARRRRTGGTAPVWGAFGPARIG